jgi:hypothetical protein
MVAAGLQSLLNDRETGLVKDLCDLNFVCDEYPTARLQSVDLEEQTKRMALYTSAAQIGLPLSKSAIYDEFGIQPPDPDDPEDSLAKDPDDPGANSPEGLEGLLGGGPEGGEAPPEEAGQPGEGTVADLLDDAGEGA